MPTEFSVEVYFFFFFIVYYWDGLYIMVLVEQGTRNSPFVYVYFAGTMWYDDDYDIYNMKDSPLLFLSLHTYTHTY